MATYLAQVIRDGKFFSISYPDLPGAYAQTDQLQHVQREAERALGAYLYAAEVAGESVPPPAAVMPTLDVKSAWLLVTVDMDQYRENVDKQPVRKTVSLPLWMAKRAEKMGLSLSKVLQEALRQQFH